MDNKRCGYDCSNYAYNISSDAYVCTKTFKPVSIDNKCESSKDKGSYDFIKNPPHYNGHKIKTKEFGEATYETIDYIESLCKRLDEANVPVEAIYSIGNSAKYQDRLATGKPDGNKSILEKTSEDIGKIIWYYTNAKKIIDDMLK